MQPGVLIISTGPDAWLWAKAHSEKDNKYVVLILFHLRQGLMREIWRIDTPPNRLYN